MLNVKYIDTMSDVCWSVLLVTLVDMSVFIVVLVELLMLEVNALM